MEDEARKGGGDQGDEYMLNSTGNGEPLMSLEQGSVIARAGF